MGPDLVLEEIPAGVTRQSDKHSSVFTRGTAHCSRACSVRERTSIGRSTALTRSVMERAELSCGCAGSAMELSVLEMRQCMLMGCMHHVTRIPLPFFNTRNACKR